ncbi:MAG: NADH-quinone oxidoreductase subunit C [Bacteroidales bacterium]
MIEYLSVSNQSSASPLNDIPVLEYDRFYALVLELMDNDDSHCVNYFAFKREGELQYLCFIAHDDTGTIDIISHKKSSGPLCSISEKCFAFHGFEREIHENFGIEFEGHPWMKPLRFPASTKGTVKQMDQYPFYSIDSEELHEVGVGPVHAGIIEPGHFRFICNGEKVLHLEIQLGYQNRGMEALLTGEEDGLRRSILAESIAGDTAVGHSLAHSLLIESFGNTGVSTELMIERSIALELERIGIHLGDSAALCTDVAYQLGQVVNESLRTVVINTTQLWCGNRFGKGMIRPFGTNYPLKKEISLVVIQNLDSIMKRFIPMSDKMLSMPSVLSRFDGIGAVTRYQLKSIGAVGMAARMGGLDRDIRKSHGNEIIRNCLPGSAVLDSGDVYARALLRRNEIEQSVALIKDLVSKLTFSSTVAEKPQYRLNAMPESVGVRLAEGWRGEICHAAVTDKEGRIIQYKVKDPSFHNWMALALALRGQEISDFPVCNKSFNLSYCGHDL